MKTVVEFLDECLEVATPLPPFVVQLPDAVACILADDVRSTVDVPAADLAELDGYAVRSGDIRATPTTLRVSEEVRADAYDTARLVEGTAIKIGSGARLPQGADAVVPIDLTDRGEATVQIFEPVGAGDHIRERAGDLGAGEMILPAGTRISARHIALLAAAGHDRVTVRPAPRVVVMSVGDELVEPGRSSGLGKVFDANSHALSTAVKSAGGVVYRVGAVSDEKQILRDAIEDQLVRADIIITTGGLSYGGGDTVKEVLAPLGSMRFDAIAMSPGRQVGIGTIGDGTLIFCLPGDPVAALVGFEIFVRPALRKMAGYSHVNTRSIRARAASGIPTKVGFQAYIPVNVHGDPRNGYEFELTSNEPHTLSALAKANGLAVVPADIGDVAIGDILECVILNG